VSPALDLRSFYHSERRVRLTEMLRQLREKRYSGAVILHLQNGIPRLVEVPRVQVALREDFDKQEKSSVELSPT
jgi:hypothetical protein